MRPTELYIFLSFVVVTAGIIPIINSANYLLRILLGAVEFILTIILYVWVQEYLPYFGGVGWFKAFYKIIIVFDGFICLFSIFWMLSGLLGIQGTESQPEIFCSQCGLRNDSNAKFCNRCGSPL